MKKCVFTIVAKNYIGLAYILENSIKQYFQEFDFHIVVADEFEDAQKLHPPINCLVAKDILDITEERWRNLSFKYNLTEFCTAIKPASFIHFFKTYEKVIYLDPDILFFSSIDSIFRLLDVYKLVLTPHIVDIPKLGTSDASETIWLDCGIFNLGFMAALKTTKITEILIWWHERLLQYCFIDTYESLFTDQKWMNFIPSFLSSEELLISKDRGLNLAPWNFFEREIYLDDKGTYFVKKRDSHSPAIADHLIFVHYSAYNYNELLNGNISQHGVTFSKSYKDIELITDAYRQYLEDHKAIFLEFISKTYSYNIYEHGKPIDLFHRRLYRELIQRGDYFDNPFSTDGSFYKLLKERKLILTSKAVSIDKLNKHNLSGLSRKLKTINFLSRMFFKLIGYKRYLLFIKLMRSYSRFECQIHLVDKKYSSNNIL